MRDQSVRNRKLLNNLRMWWIIVSGITLRVFALLGAVSIAALIAVESFSGFGTPEIGSDFNVVKPADPSIPKLVFLDEPVENLNTDHYVMLYNTGLTNQKLVKTPGHVAHDREVRITLASLSDTAYGPMRDIESEFETIESHKTPMTLLNTSLNLASQSHSRRGNIVKNFFNTSSKNATVDEFKGAFHQANRYETKPNSGNELLNVPITGATASTLVARAKEYHSRISTTSESTHVIVSGTSQKTTQSSMSNTDRFRMIQLPAKSVAQVRR